MKKSDVLNLIKCHVEENEAGFLAQASSIAKDFYEHGDEELSEYIRGLISKANVLTPQIDDSFSSFLRVEKPLEDPLLLPEPIMDEVKGLVRAVSNSSGLNKFLFSGAPGSGKSETAKHLARILGRTLYAVDLPSLIDSRLGQSPKNVARLFEEIDSFPHPEKVIILFDEFDALAMERSSEHDLKEMGRVTTAVFKGLDSLNEKVLLIATTNMAELFDKALLRRFDKVIDFSRYGREDILEIAESLLNEYLRKFAFAKKNTRLFAKIVSLMDPFLYPGDLKNAIKTSLAFSSPDDPYGYLSLLFASLCPKQGKEVGELHKLGFSLREIEILSGVSKSKASRDLSK